MYILGKLTNATFNQVKLYFFPKLEIANELLSIDHNQSVCKHQMDFELPKAVAIFTNGFRSHNLLLNRCFGITPLKCRNIIVLPR